MLQRRTTPRATMASIWRTRTRDSRTRIPYRTTARPIALWRCRSPRSIDRSVDPVHRRDTRVVHFLRRCSLLGQGTTLIGVAEETRIDIIYTYHRSSDLSDQGRTIGEDNYDNNYIKFQTRNWRKLNYETVR